MNHTKSVLSDVFLQIPVRYSFIASGAALFILLLMLLLYMGSYTEKKAVKGFLGVREGVIPIYPPRSGMIEYTAVTTGSQVHQGSLLFRINTAWDSSPYQQILDHLLEKQIQRLEIHIQKKQHRLKKLIPLLEKHYLSEAGYNIEQDALQRLIQSLEDLKKSRFISQKSVISELVAPKEGVVSNLMYSTGQMTRPDKPLLTLLPKHSHLDAELYVPARKAGALKVGDKVTLQYDAYPSSRYGVFSAHIQNIGGTVLTDMQEEKPISIGEPYYKVSALLDRNPLPHRFYPITLQPGMTFTAFIFGQKRYLWQWLFDFWGNYL
ncbi:MAG: HlyD family efflux transporter periplasmic adaptor subunit [Legionellaceae bacterium]|nr:HlyD family efflux transporter periplasmic adaptor subunit [Legionellaceae bacterium]